MCRPWASTPIRCLALLFLGSTLQASDKLPWVFNAPRAEGYSIDLSTADPVPGTPLKAGASVQFHVTVTYSMSTAKHGVIVLVFQDDKDRSAKPDGQQVTQEVTEPHGTVTISDTITVPTGAKELRVFIPLVPDGIEKTSGEITLRYPIKTK
jgi:hypothetical protein